MNRLSLCISQDDYSVKYGCSAQSSVTTGGFNRYFKRTNSKRHVVTCTTTLIEADYWYFRAFYLDWQNEPQPFICKLVLEGFDYYGSLLQDYECSFVKDSVMFDLNALHFRVSFQLDVFINPLFALTSRPYTAYSLECVASKSNINSALWIVPNVGYDSESTQSSASIKKATIRDILNVGYSSVDSVISEASIKKATIRDLLNNGYTLDSASSSALIGSASMRKALIEEIIDIDRFLSSSAIISAKFTNYEISYKPTNIRYVVNGSQIDYTFDAEGEGFTYNYYASSTPMNISSMPTPKATGITAHSYSDLTPLSGDFYVRFSATNGVNEYISDELIVNREAYLLMMPFSSDKNDHGKFNLTSTSTGSVVIQDGALYVPSGAYLTFNTTGLTELNLGTSDFEFGVEVALMPSGGGNYPCIFGVGTSWESGAMSMQFNPQSRFMCAIMSPSEQDVLASTNQVRDGVTFVKYVVRRVSGVWITYKDGVAGTSLTNSAFIANFSKNNAVTVGAAVWSVSTTSSHSMIKNLYLKKI